MIGGIDIKAIKLMLSVLALAMLTLLGAAQDDSGFGYPPGYSGDGSGQGSYASDPAGTYGAQASDVMASEAFGRDHGDGDHRGDDHRGDDRRGDHNWGDDHRDRGHDWLGVGGYSYHWTYPTYYYYSWYPYYTTYYPNYYYYTTPAVYKTYKSPALYNWYDPWWAVNAYGVTGKTYHTTWTWKSHGGHFFADP